MSELSIAAHVTTGDEQYRNCLAWIELFHAIRRFVCRAAAPPKIKKTR
jgi:hypothetical protein